MRRPAAVQRPGDYRFHSAPLCIRLLPFYFFSSFLHARPPAGTEKAFETTGSFVSEVRPRHSQRLAQAPEGHTTPQASQKARNALPPASSAPPPVNGVLPAAYCIFWGLNTIPLRSKPAAKALLFSTAQPRVVVSLTAKRQGPLHTGRGPRFFIFRAKISAVFTQPFHSRIGKHRRAAVQHAFIKRNARVVLRVRIPLLRRAA